MTTGSNEVPVGGVRQAASSCGAPEARAVREVRGALSAAQAVCAAPTRAVRRNSSQAVGHQAAGHIGASGGAARPARRRREQPLRRLLPQALVVACLAGGTSAFVADDKTIQLSIDGKPRILHTFADDVAGLLDDEGIVVGAHDMVAPAPRTKLSNDDEVAVRHARRLRLTVDGARRQVWTTAPTVDGALRVLGVRPEGAYLSVSRSRRIDRTGLTLAVRTERTVRIVADGRTRTLHTNAATVRAAVHQAGIRLHGLDTLSAVDGSFPHNGQTVSVVRIRIGRKIRSESIPFQVRRVDDPALPRGTEVVTRSGRPGTRRIIYATRTVDGVEQPLERLTAEVVREPRTQRLAVGTKVQVKRVEAARGRRPGRTAFGSGGHHRRHHHGSRHDGTRDRFYGRLERLDWEALARCESGGRPNAVDPSGTYGGLYQFDVTTWRSLGARGRPQDATRAEQTRRAKQLYASRGAAPWPVCGRRLGG